MKRIFKFHQDIKVSIWQRQHFEENDGQETIQLYLQGEEQPFATNVDNNP